MGEYPGLSLSLWGRYGYVTDRFCQHRANTLFGMETTRYYRRSAVRPLRAASDEVSYSAREQRNSLGRKRTWLHD